MLTVIYDSINGTAVTDGNAEAYVNNVLKAGVEQVTVGTAIVVDTFRVMVVRKVISPAGIQFKYGDQLMVINSEGMLDAFPKGFCDQFEKLALELLGWN